MDPIVEEIRRYREEYAKSQDYDLYKIYNDLKEKQKSGRKVVSFLPKPARFNTKSKSESSSYVYR